MTQREPEPAWTETDSQSFLDIAEVAVPARREQMEMLWSLIPATPDEPFSAVELGCGEALLAEGLLQRFPRARILALDGSQTMIERARDRLHPFGPRAEVRAFDLHRQDWLVHLPAPLRCVVSSLTIHHLDSDGKRRLFRTLREKLEPGGALLIADIVTPPSDQARSAFGSTWNELVRQQSLALTGSLKAFESFLQGRWNCYTLDQLHPGDTPSRLFDQLKWLEEAGFSAVDCFWMRAGHAIYGGDG